MSIRMAMRTRLRMRIPLFILLEPKELVSYLAKRKEHVRVDLVTRGGGQPKKVSRTRLGPLIRFSQVLPCENVCVSVSSSGPVAFSFCLYVWRNLISIRLENSAKPAFLTRCDSIFQLKLSYRPTEKVGVRLPFPFLSRAKRSFSFYQKVYYLLVVVIKCISHFTLAPPRVSWSIVDETLNFYRTYSIAW